MRGNQAPRFRVDWASLAHTMVRIAAPGLALAFGSVSEAQQSTETRRVDVGGFSLSITCLGAGGPTVVLDGGAGTWSVHYRHLQDAIAATTRVCAYDRAGIGASDPSTAPRTSQSMSSELHRLLTAAGEPGPYVLVGHSLGGYNVRVFADRYREEVAGVVLMEAAHEAQFERLPIEVAAAIDQAGPRLRALAEMARTGSLPELPTPDLPAFAAHPQLRRAYAKAIERPSHHEAIAGELEGARESAAQAARSDPLGDLPLIVLTAGNSYAPYAPLGIPVAAANKAWLDLQAELLDLSTDARHLIAPSATHQIDVDAPGLVVTAVARLVRAARRGPRVAAAPSPEGVGARLARLWDDYVDAINARSLDRLMDFFSPDAVLMPPSQPAVHGASGARAWFESLFDGTTIRLAMPTHELHVMGDWAVRRGTYEVTLTSTERGERATDRGKFLQVWERQSEGEWRIVRGVLNSDLPGPRAPDEP